MGGLGERQRESGGGCVLPGGGLSETLPVCIYKFQYLTYSCSVTLYLEGSHSCKKSHRGKERGEWEGVGVKFGPAGERTDHVGLC